MNPTNENDHEGRLFRNARQPRFHESDIRVGLAILLFLALGIVVGLKIHYASAVSFRDTCSIDQLVDPIITVTAGSLTTILGFYSIFPAMDAKQASAFPPGVSSPKPLKHSVFPRSLAPRPDETSDACFGIHCRENAVEA